MQQAKFDIKCRDCDSKNVTINQLNEKINDLTRPVVTTYSRSPSPVIRRNCSYTFEENENFRKPKVTRVSSYNRPINVSRTF